MRRRSEAAVELENRNQTLAGWNADMSEALRAFRESGRRRYRAVTLVAILAR